MAFSNGTSQTIDVDDAELHITKASEYLKLNVTGYYQCEATVVGNVILLGSMHTTFTNNQGVLFDMDIHESNGVLLDNTLTFVNQITGTATSQGVTYEFDSWFSNEALKK